jgi:hypothetical protein
MKTLRHPQHISVSGRFYVAQFFDLETGDVLAGPVPELPLDPGGMVPRRAAGPPNLQRLRREQYELLPDDQEYPWPTISPAGEANG